MSSLPLQLTATASAAAAVKPQVNPFRLERRRAERHRVRIAATGLGQSKTDDRVAQIFPLELRSLSDTGAGALAAEPLEPGMAITVCFTPHGPERGFDAVGRVVRCRATPEGHEVGIRFEARPAA